MDIFSKNCILAHDMRVGITIKSILSKKVFDVLGIEQTEKGIKYKLKEQKSGEISFWDSSSIIGVFESITEAERFRSTSLPYVYTREDMLNEVRKHPKFSNPSEIAFVGDQGTEYTGQELLDMLGL